MAEITQEESLLLQCLSMTSLLGELDNADFLKSDYFNSLPFSNSDCKEILRLSGMGNPATMQIMLYALLTIPKELLSQTAYKKLVPFTKKINPLAYTLIEEDTNSSYYGEREKKNINYFRHIRNAVAHSKCRYISTQGKNFVLFEDSDSKTSEKCVIRLECYKVGIILMELQRLIMEYYNSNHLV